QMKDTSGKYNEIEWIKSDSTEAGFTSPDTKNAEAVKMNSSEWEQSLEKLAREFGNEDPVAAGVSPAQPARLRPQKLIAQIKIGALSSLQEDEGHYYAVAVMKKGKDRVRLATIAWLKEPLRSWLVKAETQMPVTMSAAITAKYTLPAIGGPAT